jgi:3-hydroxyisobutyrate dehydrogenase-like beta-hydroxyacid dehydrogenase
MSEPATVAFIGLGIMGAPMAASLLAAGDLDHSALLRLVTRLSGRDEG